MSSTRRRTVRRRAVDRREAARAAAAAPGRAGAERRRVSERHGVAVDVDGREAVAGRHRGRVGGHVAALLRRPGRRRRPARTCRCRRAGGSGPRARRPGRRPPNAVAGPRPAGLDPRDAVAQVACRPRCGRRARPRRAAPRPRTRRPAPTRERRRARSGRAGCRGRLMAAAPSRRRARCAACAARRPPRACGAGSRRTRRPRWSRPRSVAPDLAEQLLAREHLAGVAGEDLEQLELAARELEVAPVAGGDVAARRRRRRRRRRAARRRRAPRRRSSACSRAVSSAIANGLTR